MPLLPFLLAIVLGVTALFLYNGRRRSAPRGSGPRRSAAPRSDYDELMTPYTPSGGPQQGPAASPGEGGARGETNAYPWGVWLALSVAVLWFVGLSQFGSCRVEPERQRRMTHQGYYVKPGGTFVFTAPGTVDGFGHGALARGERITLEPRFNADNEADSFAVVHTHLDRPLRVAGRCVNVPDAAWLASGDTLAVMMATDAGVRGFGVVWNEGARFFPPFERLTNTFTYVPLGRPSASDTTAERISTLVLREGLPLHTLVRLRSGNADLWDRLQQTDTTAAFVFEHLRLVREHAGDPTSRLGVLIADTLHRRSELRFFRNGVPLDPADGPSRHVIAQEEALTYGLSRRNRLSLRLPRQSVFDPVFKNVMEARLIEPNHWALPPDPYRPWVIGVGPDPMETPALRTAAVPIDGYHVGTLGLPFPLYAHARLTEAHDALLVEDGRRDDPRVALGEALRLGDFDRGATFALERIRPALPWTGALALGLLLLYTIAFSLLHNRYRPPRTGVKDVLWLALWGLALALLTVRVILAFRVSLLPPSDATPALVAIFHRSLTVSLGAFALLPGALLAARYGPRILPAWSDRLGAWVRAVQDRRPHWLVGGWMAALAGWLFLSAVFGVNESFLGTRINISTHLLIVLGLALTARPLLRMSWGWKLGVSGYLLVVLGVVTFGIGDLGSVLHIPALLLALALLVQLPDAHGLRRWTPAVLPVVVPLLLFWLPRHLPADALRSTMAVAPIQSVVQFVPDHVFYRMASIRDNETDLLALDEDQAGLTGYLGNSQQVWQMLHYAAQGTHDPDGFGSAPLTSAAMTYPTSLTDCLFAVYVLAEHGAWAGLLLVALYLLIAGICFAASWRLPADVRHRAIPLAVIGSFFGFNALYMASANAGLVVFTGQNMPLLGLYSMSDVAAGLVLFALAVGLMTFDRPEGAPLDAARPEVATGRVFLGGLAALWLYLAVSLLTLPDSYRDDYTFVPEVFAAFEQNIGTLNEAWRLEGDRLVRTPGVAVPQVEIELATAFNRRPDKTDPDGGALYLRRRSGRSWVEFNSQYYRIASPFDQRDEQAWRGTITGGRGAARPTFAGLSADARERYFEVRGNGTGVRLAPKPGYQVLVNGAPLEESTALEPLDLITVEEREEGRIVRRRSAVYQGYRPEVLSSSVWRNGRFTALYPADGLSAFLFSLRHAIRARPEAALPDTIALSIDPALQRGLQEAVARYAARRGGLYAENDPLESRRIAVTVMDPYSGEVLAMPSWPTIEPDTRAFRALLHETQGLQAQELLLVNHNLTRQAVGSTIKPLVFSAVAHGLWDALDVRRLTAHQRFTPDADSLRQYAELGGVPMTSPWRSRVHPDPTTDAAEFLIHSRNYFIGELGMLGMLVEPDTGRIDAPLFFETYHVFEPVDPRQGRHRWSFLRDDRREVYFDYDMTKVQPSAFSRRGRTYVLNENLERTVLFRTLPRLFSAYVNPDSLEAVVERQRRTLLPTLAAAAPVAQSTDWMQRVTPEPVVFDTRAMSDVRNDLVSFLLGSGQARWNAVHMAEALARLVTGRYVTATFEPRVGPDFAALPAPLGGDEDGVGRWRNSYLLAPLEDVWRTGTVAVDPDVRALARGVEGTYRMLFKTGTVDEGRGNRESESLLFVVGRWEGTRRAGRFVPGETLAGYFYMQDAKVRGGAMQKFGLAEPVLRELVQYLDQDLDAR